MDDLYIYGASGHGKVVLDAAFKSGTNSITFIDDDKNLNNFKEFRVLHKLPKGSPYIIAIGNNKIREKIQKHHGSESLVSVRHPNAAISSSSVIGDGTLICVNAIVNPDVVIGLSCIINSAAVVEHDCNIGDVVHISPNATICGNVKIGKGTHIGAAAVILPNLTIGKWVTVGAGSVVIRDIPDGATVVGNPAKIIKIK
ncbi:acetyltransferase [Nonlabens ulvanivorans]|uniref:Acetyltransferase n=1 Tax=Nonlabens ulvanivorans TaxID=906888 RepID=A0A090QW80_NONUL|nr:acetyltransferase [Nonlabens ulvanivorans]GAK99716.1 acetyltransferase [Nonlabens ulvanivorans]